MKRSLQVWFSPSQILDLAAVVLAAAEDKPFRTRLLKSDVISEDSLNELILKLNKEVERV